MDGLRMVRSRVGQRILNQPARHGARSSGSRGGPRATAAPGSRGGGAITLPPPSTKSVISGKTDGANPAVATRDDRSRASPRRYRSGNARYPGRVHARPSAGRTGPRSEGRQVALRGVRRHHRPLEERQAAEHSARMDPGAEQGVRVRPSEERRGGSYCARKARPPRLSGGLEESGEDTSRRSDNPCHPGTFEHQQDGSLLGAGTRPEVCIT